MIKRFFTLTRKTNNNVPSDPTLLYAFENARAGIGNFSNAYSNVGSDGTLYRLGIRPMPGITSVDVKSLV